MIITQKKPIEELMAMIGDAKKIAIIGCASCAQACATGGEAQVAELKAYLEAQGFEFDPASANVKDGALKAIYLKDEIAGFAIHLVQK